MVVTSCAIVETWIDEQFCGDVFVELERKGVFPLHLSAAVGGESIEACLPLDVVGESPFQVDSELRTEVMQSVLSFFQTISLCQRRTFHILEIVCKRSEVYGTSEFFITCLDIVIHTE